MKKIFIIIFLFLFSCKNNSPKLCDYKENIIQEKELFNFSSSYLVFIYLDKCMACRDVKLKLMNLCSHCDMNIYYLDLLTTSFTNNEERENNQNVSKIEDVYIKKVPHLLYINENKIETEYNGFNTISTYLESLY